MMELEDQVCRWELSKKLKDLGVPQESLWYWWQRVGGCGSPGNPWTQMEEYVLIDHFSLHPFQEIFSAFSIAELGESLPYSLKTGVIAGPTRTDYLYTQKEGDGWSCFYAMNNGQSRLHIKNADTEANARAKMRIYLLENKLIEIKDT